MKIFKKIICCLALFVFAIATSATVVGCKEKDNDNKALRDNAIKVIDNVIANYERMVEIPEGEDFEELGNYSVIAEFYLPITKILINNNSLNKFYEYQYGDLDLYYYLENTKVELSDNQIVISCISNSYSRDSVQDEFYDTLSLRFIIYINHSGDTPLNVEFYRQIEDLEELDDVRVGYTNYVLTTDEDVVFEKFEDIYASDDYLHYDLIEGETEKHITNDSESNDIYGIDLIYCNSVIENVIELTNNLDNSIKYQAVQDIENFANEYIQEIL